MTRFLAIAIAAALLAGCAADGKPVDVQRMVSVTLQPDNYCSVARKRQWSVNDTPETIQGIRSENAKWDRLCGSRSTS